jgi:hypothetical protein
MAGAGPQSPNCITAHREGADGGPAPTMTSLTASAPTGAVILAYCPLSFIAALGASGVVGFDGLWPDVGWRGSGGAAIAL